MVLKVEGGQTTGFVDQGAKSDHRKSWVGAKGLFPNKNSTLAVYGPADVDWLLKGQHGE